VNEPIEVDLRILVDDPFQLFKLLGEVISTRVVANELNFLLKILNRPGDMRILNDVFKLHSCILLLSLLELLLNGQLKLEVLLVIGHLLRLSLSGLWLLLEWLLHK
jgi:hypothetical protein